MTSLNIRINEYSKNDIELCSPNDETLKTIEEAQRGENLSKPYNNLDELFKDIELC